MAKLKLVIRTDSRRPTENSSVFIRITQNRIVKYISTGIKVNKKDWDVIACEFKKSHPHAVRYNAMLRNRMYEAQNTNLNFDLKEKKLNISEIKAAIEGKDQLDFFVFGNLYAEELSVKGNYSGFKRVGTIIKKLKTYHKNKPLKIDEITVSYLHNYITYLESELKNGVNTVHSNLKVIRRIINLAVNRDLMDDKYKSPYKRIQLVTVEGKKPYLTNDELKAIENLKLKANLRITNCRDMYVFAAYAGGIRVSDVLLLKWKNYDGVRIEFTVKKTKRLQVVKLPIKAIEIIEAFKAKALVKLDAESRTVKAKKENRKKLDNMYVFPMLDTKDDLSDAKLSLNKIANATAIINSNLKEIAIKAKINKNVSFHTSRHTFATLALQKGMRMEHVSKILGHKSLTETQIYAKIVNKDLEDAMDIFN